MRSVWFRFLMVALLVWFGSQCCEAADSRPNIVLILSDDQAWTDYGFMGHPAIQTPSLDRLAQQSATFRRGYVPTALCRPALATIVTGLYSHTNGITGNHPAPTPANHAHETNIGQTPRAQLIANIDKHPTLPRLLNDAGYLTFQAGKWWEGSYQRGGFAEGMTRGYPEPGGRHGDDGLVIGRETMAPVFDFIDRAVAEEKPFFLWYAPMMPHTPHNPPARLLEKYTQPGRPRPIASYYAMCEWFDETCGQLLDRLDQKQIADNTLVVYVTDNGWLQRPDRSSYAARSKRSPYEAGTRTPLLYRWPARWQACERNELASSIDIMPTLLAAAGVDAPEGLPGVNLLPALESGSAIERDHLFGESYAHDIADVQRPEASLLYRWVIRGHDKLLLTYDGAPGKMRYPPSAAGTQLFDLAADPHETTDLAASRPGLVAELSALLEAWYPLSERKHVNDVKLEDPSREASKTALPATQTVRFEYSPAEGIGAEAGVMRRDPSDIIRVDDQYYVWYSKGPESHGYNATVWYATSRDGRQWVEQGEAIAKGEQGSWDEHSVFTPNILVAEGRYWLFYTAVPKPFIPRGPKTTPTAIGVAVADSPRGPWKKLAKNPVLTPSKDAGQFDSLRVDDACLIVRDGCYWMYYKGRQQAKSYTETKMGVAIAENPDGPYRKHDGNPVVKGNHEVLVWPQGTGVAALIGTTGPKELTRTIQFAADGLKFHKTHDVIRVPTAAGAYRPEAFTQSGTGARIEWGVHIGHRKGSLPFIERFDLKRP